MTADPNGWPDASKPGVPLNPERDGWHFLHHPEDLRPVPTPWDAAHAAWCSGGMHSPRGVIDLGYRYLGPCQTPAEVAALVAAARREGAEAMREAAAVRVARLPASRYEGDPCQWIRALPIPEEKP